ncbi:molybdopterin-dependent oxidoreductase [Fulvivirgaceae bacterium PWU4]|uniref:Molybdopterin-dependent oxidoreductase n=1 Tax=Chryseosolibacter histidini TaxID=2782349 RepID=A0AAP2GN79_9BACT|nr:nitrate reductase [Chryseosolibacter histidini]MBT1696610.1 molybdopterin-dependent oxidoreductase [Chryseosolibacter histidini]
MRSTHDTSYKTTCSYCGVGCGIVIRKDRKNNLVLEGNPDHPVNKGMLCSKGMNLHYAMQDMSDRLLFPEMRWSRNHPLQRVSWSDAMKRAAAVFSAMIKTYGPDSVGFYVSGQCLTEEYYVANKLVKGFLGTNNIDTNSRLCMSSAVAGYAQMLGEDAVPVAYEDIELSDCFLIAGANPAWCHPILFRRIEAHKQKNPEVKLIVVDPRRTQTCALADLHLQINPGTDIYLYNAIVRVLIENGEVDYNFVRGHTEQFEQYRDSVFQHTVEEAAEKCDVSIHDIQLAASYIAAAKGFLTLWAMGLNQSAIGVKKNHALISLNLVTGHIGKPGSGPFSLTGQPNAMGGREVGGLATMLAAHRSLANAQHREEVAKFWGVDSISSRPGYTATQMIEALERGELKALWIICTNPLVSWPDARRAEAALANAKFVVVQDISRRSDTLQFADLILPAAGHFEKEGTMTNSERRITHLDKIVDPPGEALPDAEILCRFAKAMGFKGFDYTSVEEIYAEHCRLTKGTNIDISGLSYARLRAEGSMQWPVPEATHSGTTRLFADHAFYTPSRKAKFYPIDAENLSAVPTPELPLILTTGRIRDQWHTMTKTGKVNRLRQHIDKPFLEIHPDDAAARNIGEDDVVVIRNEQGDVRVRARISAEIKRGVVFLPMHWGRMLMKDAARANNLTTMLVDPVSKEPDFKFSRVEVELYRKPAEKIIIAGAGAASYRFLCSYRSLNSDDELLVISKEKDPFYNRVLLPEYVNDTLSWEKLQKFRSGEFEALDVSMQLENEIVAINRAEKYIIDKRGQKHGYDKLILATGSRAHIPNDAPIHLPGVFTMRTRYDADRLKNYLSPNGQVLIIGGGLLGLELAVSLRDIDVQVSILQLGSRLMERQIDNLAGQLLLDFIEEKNITVYINDQMQSVEQDIATGKLSASFRSGKIIRIDAIVYAVGTRPNIEFAQEAGVETARGIIVNDHLQTNDPDIFAMGEIAEHRGKALGITSAAEKQADILARFIHGDMQSLYDGAVPMNILKLSGLDLCSIGIAEIPADDDDYEEILFIDKSKRYYKKCIIKDDRLVGAILIGDKSEFAEFKTLIEDKIELSERRMQLLRSGKKTEPMLGKLVCSCNQVGAGNLQKLLDDGCTELGDICRRSGAGLGCGSCKPEIQQMIRESLVKV